MTLETFFEKFKLFTDGPQRIAQGARSVFGERSYR